jgi:aryl-alcohol dehydrogenase-like predicted oxidoreductase
MFGEQNNWPMSVNCRIFTTANIMRATSVQQLKSNIDSLAINLSADIIDGIEMIHQQHPNPAP